MLESRIKSRIVSELRARGYWARRMPADGLTGGGHPDILLMLKSEHHRGRACWLEGKQPGEQPTRLQQASMDEITRGGGRAAVVHSVHEALQIVDAFEQEEA